MAVPLNWRCFWMIPPAVFLLIARLLHCRLRPKSGLDGYRAQPSPLRCRKWFGLLLLGGSSFLGGYSLSLHHLEAASHGV